MTTQSKSVLVPFLIIAGLLFVVALGWKFFGGDQGKTVTESAQVPVEVQPVDEVKPAQVNNTAPANTMEQVQPEPYLVPTKEEREEARQVAKSHMKLAMRYQNAEQALAALQEFGDAGNKEMVREMISFIDKAYPNTDIPSEFLDL